LGGARSTTTQRGVMDQEKVEKEKITEGKDWLLSEKEDSLLKSQERKRGGLGQGIRSSFLNKTRREKRPRKNFVPDTSKTTVTSSSRKGVNSGDLSSGGPLEKNTGGCFDGDPRGKSS